MYNNKNKPPPIYSIKCKKKKMMKLLMKYYQVN